NLAIFQLTDAGMQGPGSVSHDYYYVDRRTWLPLRWEYRHVRQRGEELVQTLSAEYDRPLPAWIADVRLPGDAQIIDTRLLPTGVPQDNYTRSGEGITARLMPVKVDSEGNVLAHLRVWLGPVRLGVEQDGLSFSADAPSWARS